MAGPLEGASHAEQRLDVNPTAAGPLPLVTGFPFTLEESRPCEAATLRLRFKRASNQMSMSHAPPADVN